MWAWMCVFVYVYILYVCSHVPHPVLCGWRCLACWNKLYSNKSCSSRINIHLTLAPLSLFIATIKTHLILKDFNIMKQQNPFTSPSKCHSYCLTMIHFNLVHQVHFNLVHLEQLHFDWFINIFLSFN